MHRDKILGMNLYSSARWNIRCGGRWDSTITWGVFAARLFSERRKMGTPFHLQLSILSRRAAKVGVWESGETPSVWRYPSYWARTVSVRAPGRMDDSSLKVSFRTASASKEAGGSIATNESSCSKWFWNISRNTPTLS